MDLTNEGRVKNSHVHSYPYDDTSGGILMSLIVWGVLIIGLFSCCNSQYQGLYYNNSSPGFWSGMTAGVYLEVWVRGAGMLTTMDIVTDHEEDGVQVLLEGREQQVDLVELG